MGRVPVFQGEELDEVATTPTVPVVELPLPAAAQAVPAQAVPAKAVPAKAARIKRRRIRPPREVLAWFQTMAD